MTRPIRILLAEDDTAARTLLNDFFAPLADRAAQLQKPFPVPPRFP